MTSVHVFLAGEEMVDFTMQHWRRIGLTDEDVAELAARRQCHIGSTAPCDSS